SEHLLQTGYGSTEFDWRLCSVVRASDRKQLVGERGAPLAGVANFLQVARVAIAATTLQQQIGAAADDGQQVVEVVRDARGELTDRLHLLRAPQLRLGLQQLEFRLTASRDVFENGKRPG